MTAVADASLALKWVLDEEHTDNAVALRDYWRESAEPVIAPPVFGAEVTNALHQRVRRGQLERRDATDMLEALLMAVTTLEPPNLYARALELAGDLGLGATYDALYLALAESERCEIWTADLRLVHAARWRFPQVRWVTEII